MSKDAPDPFGQAQGDLFAGEDAAEAPRQLDTSKLRRRLQAMLAEAPAGESAAKTTPAAAPPSRPSPASRERG